MDWQARLAERREIYSERPVLELPKLTKGGFVSSDSTSHGHPENIAVDVVALRTRLLAAADTALADPKLIHRLTATDVAACAGLSGRALRAYVRALGKL
jgi:hypothetical protein